MGKFKKIIKDDKIVQNVMKYFLIVVMIFLCFLLYQSKPSSTELIILFSLILIIVFGYDISLRYENKKINIKKNKEEKDE